MAQSTGPNSQDTEGRLRLMTFGRTMSSSTDRGKGFETDRRDCYVIADGKSVIAV
jgi:hypothetical protein